MRSEGVGEGFFFSCWFLYAEPSPFFMSVYWKSLLNPPIKPAEVCVCLCVC